MSYIDDDNLWKENLYETLGIPEDISDGDLKKAYLKLAKKYHPDKFPEENEEKIEAQRLFSKITVAYDVLSDPKKKKHYFELRRLLASHIHQQGQQSSESTQPQDNNKQTQTQQNSTEQKPAEQKPPEVKKPENHVSAEKIKEDQAKKLFDIAMESLKKNKLDDAIDFFKKAINTKTDVAEFHTQLGIVYKKKNWAGMAINEFKLALKYNPKDNVAKKNLDELGGGNSDNGKDGKKGGFFSSLFGFGKKK
ncbi:MAG: DnaJ domain-containing protein [Cyanobacteriota bacterium]